MDIVVPDAHSTHSKDQIFQQVLEIEPNKKGVETSFWLFVGIMGTLFAMHLFFLKLQNSIQPDVHCAGYLSNH